MQATCSAAISGVGAYFPEETVKSAELLREIKSSLFGVSERYLERVTGIKERRFSADKEEPSTLAALAGQKAMLDAGIATTEIDMIVFCGIDRDMPEPATALRVQDKLCLYNAKHCYDVSNACHGMMTGLDIAHTYICGGKAKTVLVCTGEKPSRITKGVMKQMEGKNDKELFKKYLGAFTVGDAGAAVVVTQCDKNKGIKWMGFESRGQLADLCYYKHTDQGIEFQMLMEKISNTGIQIHKEMINKTYSNLNWRPNEIDVAFCHLTGKGPHLKLAEVTGIPLKKMPETYERFGNTTSASLVTAMFLNKPRPGQKSLLLAAGSGLVVGQGGYTM